MSGRAVSSVLDVTVCLLLISASTATLIHAPTPSSTAEPDRADAVLEVVTTTTTWIEYPLADGSNRTAHGTLANLVAAGAVTNATGNGDPPHPSINDFRRAVTAEVRHATARIDARVQVLARWRPYPGSQVLGRFAVGPSPPASANLHAASMTIPWEPTGTDREPDPANRGRIRLTVRKWSR